MNIVLIGMSGAGKSTLGKLLAEALGMEFVDTDLIIQQHENRTLQEIIDMGGINGFLRIEETIVSGLQRNHHVISTGGSVIYSEKAMKALKQNGWTIYLDVPFEQIEKRLTSIPTRGIVMKNGKSLKDVYEERVPMYVQYGDETLDCSNKTVEQCVNEAIKKITKRLEGQ